MVKFMKKYIKCMFLLILIMLILTGCETGTGSGSGGGTVDPLYHECLDNQSEWKIIKEATCNESGLKQTFCTICGDVVDEEKISELRHYYVEDVAKEATCTEEGILRHTCKLCGDVREKPIKLKDHEKGRVTVIKEQTSTTLGIKEVKCKYCDEVLQTLTFVNNGYLKNGKLSVKGADLVNQYGDKFQLFGVSTHGLQWFGRYANFDTIASIQENFGNNIIRFAFYTDENGYCDGTESKQKQMLEDLIRGVDAATALGLYVIIDWHMVGAENYADKNPLTYLEQSKQFFSYISNYYKDQDNILYEIMNEPNGSTTWADCKKYANEIIPLIERLADTIEDEGNVQLFITRANVLAMNLDHLMTKYDGQPESYYESFKKLMEINQSVKTISQLRREAVTYQRYLAYQSTGSIYNLENKAFYGFLSTEAEFT